jgi:hypothetical protein
MRQKFHSVNRISVRLKARFIKGTKKFKNVLRVSDQLDINRSNTTTIVLDMAHEIFGYDKYSEITSDFDIKNTSGVLAVENDKKLAFLIEVYPIKFDMNTILNIQLNGYGHYQGMDRVIVTNGIYWKVFNIDKQQKISNLVSEFNFLDHTPIDSGHIEKLYKICRESFA